MFFFKNQSDSNKSSFRFPENLKSLSIFELIQKLNSSLDGLSQEEVLKRQKQYGLNELKEKKSHSILKFFSYFWGPIPWMIELALILSAIVKQWPDFFIIIILLISNAFVGFFEEYQAGNIIASLKEKLAVRSQVKRNKKWVFLSAKDLVPGDIIYLRLGDIVPADARLLKGASLEIDQSALTGESLPIEKKEGDSVFSGSIVRQGEVEALVYATGINTYFGKTTELVQKSSTMSHFQKAVLKMGHYLINLALILVVIIIAVAVFRGDSFLTTLHFALVLTVAAIPVALPVVLSITLSVGSRILARKKAIVSRLVSIEELAGMDVLCADKTGTMTQNSLTLGEFFTLNNFSSDELLLHASLATKINSPDPIDLAILHKLENKSKLDNYQITSFIPFDPVSKRTEATVKKLDGTTFKVTKGSPQVILALVDDRNQIKQKIDNAIAGFAARGFRCLGVARCDQDDRWQYLGILSLFDPPRTDTKEMIQTAHQMGVNVKMITGDQQAIAKETSLKLDLGSDVLNASDLGDMKRQVTSQLIEKANGFSQLFPEHKFLIIDSLQKNNHIVGMTGDGVNDVPALKKADCGIAVSSALDAARAAADIVLLEPGLAVIIDAIKESRKIFQRMNSYVIYRISETIRILIFMLLSILIFNFYPISAVMIVMLALLNDGAILAVSYDRVIYKENPLKWNIYLVLWIATLLGIFGVISSFGLFYMAEKFFHIDRSHIQSMMYLKLSLAGHLTIFVARTRNPFWSPPPAFILWTAVLGTQIIATFISVYGFLMDPIGWHWAFFIWGYALVSFFIADRFKLLAYWVYETIVKKFNFSKILKRKI